MTLVRDLVNTSPSHLYPETFAAEAQRVAVAAGLDIEVLDHIALAGGGYGGITGVGQGSVHPPRLVRLAYQHPEASKTVVFAGKGITFDSGGLSLKPPKSMEAMKSDMGGAAAVLGALQAIAALKPKVNVVGYLAMAENMPGGHAQRPSDVITIFGGKTVEVLNTDAEGRLVLADVLARSAQDSPDLLIDVATLTGAQLVALGPRISGVMGSDDAVAAAIADDRPRGRRAGLADAAAGGAAQGPGLGGRRHRERGRRAVRRHAGGRPVPEGICAGRRALGTCGHCRPRLPRGRAVRIHPQGRDRRRSADARPGRDRRARRGGSDEPPDAWQQATALSPQDIEQGVQT